MLSSVTEFFRRLGSWQRLRLVNRMDPLKGLSVHAHLFGEKRDVPRHMIASLILGKIPTLIARWKVLRPVSYLFSIGAASGDRTHDILSHSQAFCL